MKVIPVHFSTEHKSMLTHCKMMVEKQAISIHPKFVKLVTSLRTAIENGEGVLDKGPLPMMMSLTHSGLQ